ncbi:two-component regulator propeller domain-containing protein [Natronoflexus pectinivorans]|uniref:Ligand-binding sensor domain-containing protein n=1 Tax=Natronoflexus pectinivorans TaxID=682526 RepID=A0A4R2G8I3_9BACT|nr:two-component regulator propeller domain-containing protein [Natronoflexus pectinivorans]TCO04053.1 ligand-binding sensor domain-containing protein [Natronoflexus pectinivorans]
MSLIELKYIRQFLGLLFCLLQLPLSAALSSIQQFTIMDGLSNNSVNTIFQDSRGFLWIGTEDGLNRYDGYRFEVFRFIPGQNECLTGNRIVAITEDSHGNIWIGTRSRGISVLQKKDGRFRTYQHDLQNQYSLPENGVFGFFTCNLGELWVKTENYLCRYDSLTDKFHAFGHFSNVFKRIHAFGFPVFEESDSTFLIGTKDGLNRFDRERRVFHRLYMEPESQEGNQHGVFDILSLNNEQVLLGTTGGLKILNTNEISIVLIPGEDRHAKVTVNSLMRDKTGRLWVGTNSGLDIFDPQRFQHRSAPLGGIEAELLDRKEITSVFEDESGIIWVGTRHHGIFKLNFLPPKFKSIGKSDLEQWPGHSLNILSVINDSQGNIWAGTLTRGLFKFNREKRVINHYIINRESYLNKKDAVWSLHEDYQGRIWIGTERGIYYIEPFSNVLREFNYGYDARYATLLRNNVITSITSNHSGIWFGTRFGLYQYVNGRISSYFKGQGSIDGLSSDEILSLSIDQSERLWIGTSSGINYFDELMGEIREVNFISSGLEPLNQVFSIAHDQTGNIWLGTGSGLLRMYKTESDSMRTELLPSLSNELIASVITDKSRNIWFSSSRGVSLLTPDGVIRDFDTHDGLPGHQFNTGSGSLGVEGEIYFGGVNGLCWIHPDSIQYNLHQPRVTVTGITLCHRGECTEILEGYPDQVKFRFKPGMLMEINYAAMDFAQPHKNSFKVKLVGYDKTWRPLTRNNSVVFSNLLPGKYKFMVLGSNNDLIWSEAPFEMKIEITPPIWMTNYAYAFYLLMIIFLIQMIINYRIRHYKKVNRSLTEKNVDKIRLEQQREALTRINQNLTDSINYATRIQSAMIPSEKVFRSVFPQSFIYFRPRDLVSGDFYWMHKDGHKLYVAVVDCTGHGVPGAFMSIIGMDLLKNIITGKKIDSPAQVLKQLSLELDATLRKNDQSLFGSETIKDGMDMGLCVIDTQKREIEFAGAVNGLYLIRNNELLTYKGDRFAIGRFNEGNIPEYTSKRIELMEDDIIYLFTDGYVDQFGGAEKKKFKYRRFRHLLLNIHKLHPDDQKAILHQKFEEWRNGEDQVDDILIVGLKPLKEDAPEY